MIAGVIAYIEGVLLPLGALGVFLGSLIEQIIAPIPSSLVQLAAGFLLIDAQTVGAALAPVFVTVAIPSAVAIVIGSAIVYWISYVIGKPFVQKFGWYLGVSWSQVERLEKKFETSRKDDVFLFILRTLPVVPTVVIDVFCGAVRYHFVKYMVITFFGSLIRGQIFGLIGWKVGNVYTAYAEVVSSVEKYVLLALVAGVVGYVLWRVKRKKI